MVFDKCPFKSSYPVRICSGHISISFGKLHISIADSMLLTFLMSLTRHDASDTEIGWLPTGIANTKRHLLLTMKRNQLIRENFAVIVVGCCVIVVKKTTAKTKCFKRMLDPSTLEIYSVIKSIYYKETTLFQQPGKFQIFLK